MNLPGFTADASLYDKSELQFVPQAGTATLETSTGDNAVQPAGLIAYYSCFAGCSYAGYNDADCESACRRALVFI